MRFVLERCDHFLDVLKNTIRQEPLPITNVEISESRDGSADWAPIAANEPWGSARDTWYRFRASVVIPPSYDGRRVYGLLSTGEPGAYSNQNPEIILHVNGQVRQGLDINHTDFLLTDCAKAGERFDLEFESYSGRGYAIASVRYFAPELFLRQEDAHRLYYHILTAQKAAELFSPRDNNRIQIEQHLTHALNLLDCRIPGSEAYFASVRAAADCLETEFYGKYCGHGEMIANCIGHTHIDVAWLWTLEVTRAKAAHSFATELSLLAEYPEHRFSSSQPQLYQFVKEDYPELYARIQATAKAGRWEIEGAMWLEADCNLTSGEGLVRQIVHGKRFMQQEFGVDSNVLWLPDVFGYSAALPQILKKSGVDCFVTNKIFLGDTNRFPYDTFLWKGVDGTEIFSQYITAADGSLPLGQGERFSDYTYSSPMTPISLARGWETYQQKELNNEILVTFGYGDGGGGVNREMLELQRRMEKGIPGLPRTRITTIRDALERIRKNTEGKKLPKWFGELYLEYHRGTYTSMGKSKRNNRKSEFLLQSVEAAMLADHLTASGPYRKDALETGWKTVLLNQFHDILPGSSIKEVYDKSEAQYAALQAEHTGYLTAALENLAGSTAASGVFVYNPTGICRSGIVELEGRSYFAKDVPAWGWKVLPLADAEEATTLQASPTHLENDFFSLNLDEKGHFTSIYDKKNQREVLPAGKRGNVLIAYDDHPASQVINHNSYIWDNWELSSFYEEIQWEIDDVSGIRVIHQDALSASLEITRRFQRSEICQVITIYRDLPRIDFDTTADWHEQHLFVKAEFPVDVMSDKATYEIQYGSVERPAHQNTSWDQARFEVCAQKWADYGEADYGVALLNDCKYGYSIHDGVMRLSLLKCGTWPNPEADQGLHRFTYSLMPHGGDWRTAQVANEAYALNCPLLALPAQGGGNLSECFSLACATEPNIFITTVKEAEDGQEIILRAYETQGRRTKSVLSCGVPIACVQEVDLLEQTEYARLDTDGSRFTAAFKPYEIKTFRLTRK